MATGFMQRFKGKIVASQIAVSRGGFGDASSGVSGFNTDYLQKIPIAVTATANVDLAPISAPPGLSLLSATVYTTTAFTGTTVTIQIGSSAGDSSYVAAVTIKAVGIVPLTLVGAAAAALAVLPAAPNLFARVVQTGPTNVGAALLVLNYG